MAALPPLDKLDPADAWAAWKPTTADPWDRKWAAHLYRRAGFGASAAELAAALKTGHAATLDLLLAGEPGANNRLSSLTEAGLAAAEGDTDGNKSRTWWLSVMLDGGHPLREKMTLFWHNHFATSIAKIQNAGTMVRQNALFREHALGKFAPLLKAVGRDGAMLVWLDSNSNLKGKPNENYAREVMELFSLGVGNYTEKDIREAARAFTGWHTDGSGFKFDADKHDDGEKTVLGKTGNWDGDDIVRIVLDQPAAARFIVGKLYSHLVSETAPPAKLLEPLCESFRKSEYDVAALVKTILASRLFYSDHAFRKRVKSPIEYTLGAVRGIYHRYDKGDAHYRALEPKVLVKWLAAMGQVLFAPPNVKGWPGGRTWLNTATVLERDNFIATLTSGTLWAPPANNVGFSISTEVPPPRAFDPARVPDEAKAEEAEAVVGALLDVHAPGGIRAEAQKKLVEFVADGKPTGLALNRRTREAAHAILTMPEYQLS